MKKKVIVIINEADYQRRISPVVPPPEEFLRFISLSTLMIIKSTIHSV